jgi:hypothetical protein
MNTPRLPLVATLALAAALAAPAALAQSKQFANAPAVAGAFKRPSEAQTPLEYRSDGARHIYAAYGKHIHKGKMPPLLYGVAIIETEIDAQGNVQNVRVGGEHDQGCEPVPGPGQDGLGALHRHLAGRQERPLPARHADRRPALTDVSRLPDA